MRVRVLRVDATYTGTFAAPSYELPGRWLRLFENLQTRLNPFGFRHEDMRVESTGVQPNDFHVSGATWAPARWSRTTACAPRRP